MAKKKRYYNDGMYEGKDGRMAQERSDRGMIKEDMSAIANLPKQSKYVEYPKEAYYKAPELYDTLGGIDDQMRDDVRAKDLKRKNNPEKY